MPEQEAPAAIFAAAGWQVFDSDDEDIRGAIASVLAKEGYGSPPPHPHFYTLSNHSRFTSLLSVFITPRSCSSSRSHSRDPSTNSTCLAPGALAWVFALGLKCPVVMTIASCSISRDGTICRFTMPPISKLPCAAGCRSRRSTGASAKPPRSTGSI